MKLPKFHSTGSSAPKLITLLGTQDTSERSLSTVTPQHPARALGPVASISRWSFVQHTHEHLRSLLRDTYLEQYPFAIVDGLPIASSK